MDSSFTTNRLSSLQNHYKTLFKAIILTLLSLLLFLTSDVYAQQTKTILIVGDSLSAEYGLQRGTGWVALMAQKLKENGFTHIGVANASISGDTTAGGHSRIQSALEKHQPELVIIELGANDALRGLSLSSSKNNLQNMINNSQKAGAQVLLLGVQVPPNYGKSYMDQFAQMYIELAQQNKIELIPFFLAGVADAENTEQYFLRDRVHPNENAQPIILQNIYPTIIEILIKE